MAKSKVFNFLENSDYKLETISVPEIIDNMVEDFYKLNKETKVFANFNKYDSATSFDVILSNINILMNSPFYNVIPPEIREKFNDFFVSVIVTSTESKEVVNAEMIGKTIEKLVNSNFEGIESIENCKDGSIHVLNDGHIYVFIPVDVRALTHKFFSEQDSEFKFSILVDCYSDIFESISSNLLIDKKIGYEDQKILFENITYFQTFAKISIKNMEARNKCFSYLSLGSSKQNDTERKDIVYH